MEKVESVTSEKAIVKSSPKTLIDKLRQEYHDAMRLIDVQSGEEIKSGQEMKGIMTHANAANRIAEIHETLSKFYCALFRNLELLKRNDSQRLRQLGHELIPTMEILKDLDGEDKYKGSSPKRVGRNGYRKR